MKWPRGNVGISNGRWGGRLINEFLEPSIKLCPFCVPSQHGMAGIHVTDAAVWTLAEWRSTRVQREGWIFGVRS